MENDIKEILCNTMCLPADIDVCQHRALIGKPERCNHNIDIALRAIMTCVKASIESVQYIHPCGQCDHKDNPVNMFCPECRALENYRNKVLEVLTPHQASSDGKTNQAFNSDKVGRCSCKDGGVPSLGQMCGRCGQPM